MRCHWTDITSSFVTDSTGFTICKVINVIFTAKNVSWECLESLTENFLQTFEGSSHEYTSFILHDFITINSFFQLVRFSLRRHMLRSSTLLKSSSSQELCTTTPPHVILHPGFFRFFFFFFFNSFSVCSHPYILFNNFKAQKMTQNEVL